MAGPHETDHSGQTQQPEWGGTDAPETGGQPPIEDGGGAATGGYTGGGYGPYGQYGPPGPYGGYGAYGGGGGGQPSGWGYAEQPSGSGAGWGYAPGYVPGYAPPSATPGSTSRPLPGSPEQAPQDAQGWAGGYAGGYYGPPSQSLQPFQPPQPPYGSYGPVSQYGGYGQYGPPSQYGGYGGYGQYGPPSAWGPPVVIEEQVRQPWSMRRKLAVFGGLVALLVVLAGGGLGYTQYNAPTSAANRICSDFQSQRYVDMYGLFDTQLQARMTSVEFAQAVLDLDRAEGQTAKCDVAVHANGFTDSSTTATIVLTRPNANGLQGAARLKNEGGSWKVTTLDQSLFGVDLRALNRLDNYCTALTSQTYDAAYGMLDKGMQGTQKVADFRREAGWRDEIDGNATNCHAAAIGANNDSTASMTLSVTRSRAGEHTGTIMLVVEGAAWKVHTVADEALGTDIGPIRTATRFCNDLARGNYGDLANLILGLIPAGADIASLFNGDTNGIKWTGCTLDLSTYKVSGAGSSLNAGFSLEEISSGRTGNISIELIFTKVGHDWKLSNMKIVNP